MKGMGESVPGKEKSEQKLRAMASQERRPTGEEKKYAKPKREQNTTSAVDASWGMVRKLFFIMGVYLLIPRTTSIGVNK